MQRARGRSLNSAGVDTHFQGEGERVSWRSGMFNEMQVYYRAITARTAVGDRKKVPVETV